MGENWAVWRRGDKGSKITKLVYFPWNRLAPKIDGNKGLKILKYEMDDNEFSYNTMNEYIFELINIEF